MRGDGTRDARAAMHAEKSGTNCVAERKKRGDTETAIVFLEQLYPFPDGGTGGGDGRGIRRREKFVWVQEEPANMGALAFMLPQVERLAHGRTGAERKAVGERESRDGIGQGARDGAENAAVIGIYASGTVGAVGGELDAGRTSLTRGRAIERAWPKPESNLFYISIFTFSRR